MFWDVLECYKRCSVMFGLLVNISPAPQLPLVEKSPLVEIPEKGVIFHTRRRCVPFAHTRRSAHLAPQTTDARCDGNK
jgi:hypothetical protein